MKYNPEIHHRRSIRLPGYDYSRAGSYFITICARNRECLFGEIVGGKMRLNGAGEIVESVWNGLPEHYPHVLLDAMVVMPNHVHAIIVLTPVEAGLKPAPTATTAKRHGVPEIVRAWKTFSARRINGTRRTPDATIWQHNYWEHIVRNVSEMDRIREYIKNNPAQWELDKLHPGQSMRDGRGGSRTAPTEIREPSAVYEHIATLSKDAGWMV